jgi:hypothetical protein
LHLCSVGGFTTLSIMADDCYAECLGAVKCRLVMKHNIYPCCHLAAEIITRSFLILDGLVRLADGHPRGPPDSPHLRARDGLFRGPGVNVIKLFFLCCNVIKTFLLLMMRPNKLEHLSFETFSSQVLEFESKARPNPIGAPFRCFLGKLLVLPANVRLGWKVIAGTKVLPYLASMSATKEKSFRTVARRIS